MADKPSNGIVDRPDHLLSRPDLVVLGFVILLALAVRLVNLGIFPDTVNPDEADSTQDALRILYGMPPQNGFFGIDWTQQPAFSAYLLSAFLKLFGSNVVAVRLPSVLLSAAALVPFYLVLRRQFSAVISLSSTFLLATNLWYLNFSRSGWNNVHIALYMLGAMLFLLLALDALRTRPEDRVRWLSLFAMTGVFCALGLYGYTAGRSIILAVIAFCPFGIWFYRRGWRRVAMGYLMIVLVVGVLFWPQGSYVLSMWDTFNTRTRAVLIFNTSEYSQDPVGTLGRQVSRNVVGFWDGRVNHTARYTPDNESLLDPATGGLVLAGMVLSVASVRARRRQENWLWWTMLLVAWGITEIPTANTPDGARGVGWMPALLYFSALAMEEASLFARRIVGLAGWTVPAAAGVLVLAVGYSNVNHYVVWQSQPTVRQQRSPFVTVQEFPQWAAEVVDRAVKKQGSFPVNQWRENHPLAEAVPRQVSPPSLPAASPKFVPPDIPRERWPHLIGDIGGKGNGADQLLEPRSVAVDARGNIYVLDSHPKVQSVKKYDSSGRFLLSWGGPGQGDGKFASAWALVVNGAGEVLVLDEVNYWVQVFDANGRFLRKWGGPSTQMYHPRAMAIDAADDIYIADTGRKRVLLFTSMGVAKGERGGPSGSLPEAERLIEPAGVAVGPDGSLYVADAPRQVIRRYNNEGRQMGVWSFGFVDAINGPRLATTADGSVYATLPGSSMFLRFDANGNLLGGGGRTGSKDYLEMPSGIAVDGAGKLYVTDLNQGLVRIYAP